MPGEDDWMTGKPKWLIWLALAVASWLVVLVVVLISFAAIHGVWKLVHG